MMDIQGTGALTSLSYGTEYKGDYRIGEIEVINDQSDIAAILEQRRRRVRELGLPEVATALGTVFEDEYIIIRRDPVRFPQGNLGTYLRIIERPALDGAVGVVILPLCEGLIYLRKIFRHATRSWELEFPRGVRPPGFSPVQNVHQEISEEIGLKIEEIRILGPINSNTGLLAGFAQAFFARLEPGNPTPQPEKEEAFGAMIKLSPKQLLARIRAGEIRDSYTLSTLQLALAHDLLDLSE